MSAAKTLEDKFRPGAAEIARHFFCSSLSSQLVQTPENARGSELTASGKYIVREVKKFLGQTAATKSDAEQKAHAPSEEDLLALVKKVEERESEELSERERVAVVTALYSALDHYDILSPLLENHDVNDIIIRAFDDISVQTNRRNIQTDLKFADHDSYKAFVENLLKRAGKACTIGSPVVDAAPDPHVRVCATHESFSPPGSGPMLTIRIARNEYISLDALIHHQLAPPLILDYLAVLVATGQCSVLIAGEVGTGKTTLLRALSSRIPESEAILVIEDTHEIVLQRRFVRTLITREPNTEGAGRISPALAIRTGMRMAMNRLILGEMRDAEAAESFIDVCASGHAGMSTIHSRSAKDAIGRLELFLARAQGAVQIETIRRQIANAVSVIVFLGVDRDAGKRRILEVVEIGSFSDGAIQLSPMFRYLPHPNRPQWRREAGLSQFQAELQSTGLALPTAGGTLGLDPENSYVRGGI